MPEVYFEKPTDYLDLEFRLRKSRRPAYSKRAFARDLQISPTSLCDLLNGRAGLSEERARTIGNILKWPPKQKAHFCDLVTAFHSVRGEDKKKARYRIQSRMKDLKAHVGVDRFKIISDWQHMALLVFVQMESKSLRTEDLGKRLDLSTDETKPFLERLARAGLVEIKSGRWQAREKIFRTGDEAPSEAIRGFHAQMLGLAARAIDRLEMHERSSLSMIFSVRQDKLALLQSELRETILRTISQYVENEPHDTVQALTMQLFPIWKKGTSK